MNSSFVAPGYLLIQTWPENISSLSPFENLEIIRGRTKRYVPHKNRWFPVTDRHKNVFLLSLFRGSRSLMVANLGITSLGLRSLKEISDGDVIIMKNKNMCYTSKSHWKKLFKSNGQSATIEENADAATCGQNFNPPTTFIYVLLSLLQQHFINKAWLFLWEKISFCDSMFFFFFLFPAQRNHSCDRKCTAEGCWGSGPHMCFACSDYSRSGSCVDSCNILEG